MIVLEEPLQRRGRLRETDAAGDLVALIVGLSADDGEAPSAFLLNFEHFHRIDLERLNHCLDDLDQHEGLADLIALRRSVGGRRLSGKGAPIQRVRSQPGAGVPRSAHRWRDLNTLHQVVVDSVANIQRFAPDLGLHAHRDVPDGRALLTGRTKRVDHCFGHELQAAPRRVEGARHKKGSPQPSKSARTQSSCA